MDNNRRTTKGLYRGQLTDAQLKRLYAIAHSVNIDADTVYAKDMKVHKTNNVVYKVGVNKC